jgi:hypothetical protein
LRKLGRVLIKFNVRFGPKATVLPRGSEMRDGPATDPRIRWQRNIGRNGKFSSGSNLEAKNGHSNRAHAVCHVGVEGQVTFTR